jgi:hypothetical protein
MQLEALRQEIIAHPLLARPSLTSKLAVNRPSTSPPSPPPNPARPSFLRRAALYGSCGCDSLPVRSTRRSKTSVSLSVSPPFTVLPTANSQHRRLPSTATHRQPSPKTQHHSILTAPHIATVSASQKAYLPARVSKLPLPPRPSALLQYRTQILSCPVSQPAARCVLSSATHSQRRPLAFSHRANFLAGWCHREASLTRLRDSISCLLQSSLATRSSSAILVFSPHRNPGACVAIPHLACSRQDSDVIPHKLDRYRYHPRRIFRNHGGHCNRFAHRGVCPDERPSERPDLTESHTIVDVGRLAQKFDQRCTCIHVGNTTQQWRRS